MPDKQNSFGLLGPSPERLQAFFLEVDDQIKIEQIDSPIQGEAYFAYEEDEGLSFIDPDLGKLHLDFVVDHIRYQRKGHRGKKELIVKALGLEKKDDLVIDSTLGLAADAMFLVQLGYSVIGFERSPIVYLLLQDAIMRWNENKNEKSGRFQVIYGNAIQNFDQVKEHARCIYVDPMFPEKKKTALPKKEMQIFKKWVGEDLDGESLLMAALGSDCDRVVVKRPLKADPLKSGVIHSFKGTTVRYDLYTPQRG